MQVRTDVDRVRRVNRTAALLDVLDLALLVHYKRGATRKLRFFIQDSVRLRDFALHVAKKWELDPDFFRKRGIGGRGINADAKHSGVIEVDLARIDTRLVSLKFFRSTTSEGEHVEGQDDVFLWTAIP